MPFEGGRGEVIKLQYLEEIEKHFLAFLEAVGKGFVDCSDFSCGHL